MPDDTQLELQTARGKIAALERKVKLLQEGLHQAERLRRMYDETAQDLKSTKAQLLDLSEELEQKVRQRTQQLLAAQEELMRREKLVVLAQVADTVGHELRNPLGVINNAVYYLQATLADAGKTTGEYLGIIKEEVADAERIVSDLLDAVRTKPPHPETVDVAEAISQSLRRYNVPSSVEVRLGIPEGLPPLYADPAHLHQILWNLVSNAVEAMPQGGALEIQAQEDRAAHALRIGIGDNGIGIAPDQQARLFQPLFTTKARHIGLGLVVVKNLTQSNGGRVEVESAPGKGSRFSVILPVMREDAPKRSRGNENAT